MTKVKLDRKGVSEVLKAQCAPAVNELAQQIAADVSAVHGVDVEVESYTTDRGAAAVTIADRRGMELQVSQGALTRAATRAGLEVTAK